uniref:Uncharacterized protein n=1 Tax=Arundo donax TaxID=35708 RepID=A0A0A9B3U0_ARUDO
MNSITIFVCTEVSLKQVRHTHTYTSSSYHPVLGLQIMSLVIAKPVIAKFSVNPNLPGKTPKLIRSRYNPNLM